MRHLRSVITILLAFLLTPLAADYFAAPGWCWAVGMVMIAYESWVLLFKKTAKDLVDERARLAEARRRIEKIKEEAAMVYLQAAPGKKGATPSSLDVDRMSPVELANAARQIVQDIRGKKDGGADGALSEAA
jgi:hypothetical protein